MTWQISTLDVEKFQSAPWTPSVRKDRASGSTAAKFQNKRTGIMRNIATIHPNDDWTINVSFDDGAERRFDVKPLLDCEAFMHLKNLNTFKTVRNCGYFVEWINEVDLSADTLYLDDVPLKQ